MRRLSRRDAAIGGATIGVTIAILTQVVGPRYIDPLPVWSKLAIALVCCAVIGTLAVYSRRRARRA